MIAGLELPSEGRILIAGRDVTSLGATQRDVSMVFQSYALFPHMSVLENVCYGLRRSGLAKATRPTQRAREGLAQVGLDGLRGAPAVGTVGRPAAARRGGARAGAEALGAAVRRAAQQPRRPPAPPDARGDPRAAAAARPHRGLRDARPAGGDGGVRPHHRHERRPHRAAGLAARPLRAAGDALPRALHGRVQSGARQRAPPRCRHMCASRWATSRSIVAERRRRATARPRSRSVPRRSRSRPRPGPAGALAGTIAKASYLGTHMEYSIDTAAGAAVRHLPRVERPLAPGDAVALVFAPRGVIVVAGA